ncbi:MAG: PKD domain-containing protein, partial [Verrucomicrobia bacterium]|nr:PKD domain-containing protein [Verrucomicrobiota bacterium]
VINCTLTNNYGVGARHSTLSNCLLAGNSGHGASYSTLSNCTVSGNAGGGVEHSALTYCTLTGNWGRGASGGALTNCILTGNLGGGASGAVLQNCSLSENSAYIGGGVLGGTLYNCTLTDNSAEREGGGAYQATLYNCIVYYNTARDDGPNHFESTLNYCCTVPLPGAGVGNIDAQPQLGDCWHLTAGSSCRAAGNPAYATGLDIDSEPWISPPSIGCDEYWPGPVTGPLTVAIEAARTNAAAGYALEFQARIEGRITTSAWEFGDGVVVSNQAHTRHAWALPGAYAVTLRAYNDSNPGGVSATVAVQIVEAAVHYVTAANTNPVPPYSSWATAATNIQDAVDAAVAGALVLVSNGVYATGERDMDGASRVVVDRPITVGSVNGPEATLIVGGEWMRCVYLDANAVLSGFTLTNGHADEVGGGVRSETGGVVTNCILTGNEALGEDATGGGACGGTLHNCSLIGNAVLGSDDTAGGGAANATLYGCVLSGNWSDESGGGADDCLLYNCVLSGNSAGYGGGACYGTLYNCTLTDNSARGWGAGGACRATLYNCIVYYNKGAEAPSDPNSIDSTLNYCCTTPLPTSGIGNIANEPVFVDYAVGNFRLQSNSPCINAGNNAYVTSAQDLDGLPRIVGGTVDIGACELQSPASAISYAWLQQYGLPTDGSADFTDADGDRLNNWQEWCCRIDPTNALSVLRLLPPSSDGNDINVTWESVVGVNYFLERSTNLGASPPFLPLATNLPGQVGTTMFTDTNAAGEPPRFYRVGVTGP